MKAFTRQVNKLALVAILILAALVVPQAGTALPVGDPNSHITTDLPGGGYIEVVFLGGADDSQAVGDR